ncbi:hypothetical protein ELI55_27010 (plasmid) [Rhizobium ruizarguesonis]|uniref:hypothetical protein n=1 Tax=Rhizobium ruizarguesonis TaxID=2081791 RepID=UPI001030EDD2|nr:hypothetical protein [Rhizobium ruizarguesonis]TAT96166.1 hypothetical protein ELI55_27010 [Rhizobium ruizarguesonis]
MTDVSPTLACFLEEAVGSGVVPDLAEIVSVLARISLKIAGHTHHPCTAIDDSTTSLPYG